MCMRNEFDETKFPQWEFCNEEERDFYEDTMTIKRHKRERVGGGRKISGGSSAAIGGA